MMLSGQQALPAKQRPHDHHGPSRRTPPTCTTLSRYSFRSPSGTVQWAHAKLRQRLHSWGPIDLTSAPIPRK